MESPRQVMPPKKNSGGGSTGMIIGIVIAGLVLISLLGLCVCGGMASFLAVESRPVEIQAIETLPAREDVEAAKPVEITDDVERADPE